MGDLNMTATSKRFTDFLNEINLYTYISHKHTTFTWPRFIPKFLGIQIDHILFSENLKMETSFLYKTWNTTALHSDLPLPTLTLTQTYHYAHFCLRNISDIGSSLRLSRF